MMIFLGDVALESNISQYSQRVASGIAKLCRTAPRLKGDDWEDPNDPNVIAEKELLRAAKAIDAAASKLSNLTPRKEANSKVSILVLLTPLKWRFKWPISCPVVFR